MTKGFSKLLAPANLPHPSPSERLRLLNPWVATRYSLVKYPVPAKSSRPIAIFGKCLFFGSYLNLTLKPLSK